MVAPKLVVDADLACPVPLLEECPRFEMLIVGNSKALP